jgi:hypothetical protein
MLTIKMEIKELLIQKGLVLQAPRKEEIIARAKAKKQPLKIFYGETYDNYGNTLDSMKYYFFVSELAKTLKQEGVEVNPIILIADTATCRNVSSDLERRYMRLGDERTEFVEKANEIYGLGLRVLRMSDYIHTREFQDEREKIMQICKSDPDLMVGVEKTVPESKIEEERRKGFMYSFDEITTIMDLDIKVGPPREDLYDNIARELAQREGKLPLMSLFLTPSFPMGKNWAYFFVQEGIEDHGITAYKAGSKRLQDFRILPGRTTAEQARILIDNSFVSLDRTLPNPVLEVGVICEMAKRNLKKEFGPLQLGERFYSGKLSAQQLRDEVYRNLMEAVLNRF